jgi:uncharacterized Zn-binding protein involved in type VI secretion
MPAVVRKGDTCTGHGRYPPRANTGGSTDVFINGKGAHRKDDTWPPHGHTPPPIIGDIMASGSETVFVNGKPIARVGDDITCGSVAAAGSGNVFAG